MKHQSWQNHWSSFGVRSNWREAPQAMSQVWIPDGVALWTWQPESNPCGHSIVGQHLESLRDQMQGLLPGSTQPGQLVPEKPFCIMETIQWLITGQTMASKVKHLHSMKIKLNYLPWHKRLCKIGLTHLMSRYFFRDCTLVEWITARSGACQPHEPWHGLLSAGAHLSLLPHLWSLLKPLK